VGLTPVDTGLHQLFREAMSVLASGVAVVTARRVDVYDHTVLVGGRLEKGEPLVYGRRRIDWLMRPMQ